MSDFVKVTHIELCKWDIPVLFTACRDEVCDVCNGTGVVPPSHGVMDEMDCVRCRTGDYLVDPIKYEKEIIKIINKTIADVTVIRKIKPASGDGPSTIRIECQHNYTRSGNPLLIEIFADPRPWEDSYAIELEGYWS